MEGWASVSSAPHSCPLITHRALLSGSLLSTFCVFPGWNLVQTIIIFFCVLRALNWEKACRGDLQGPYHERNIQPAHLATAVHTAEWPNPTRSLAWLVETEFRALSVLYYQQRKIIFPNWIVLCGYSFKLPCITRTNMDEQNTEHPSPQFNEVKCLVFYIMSTEHLRTHALDYKILCYTQWDGEG